MDSSRLEMIKKQLELRDTQDLLNVWMENDQKKWSDEAFKAISLLLIQRGLDPKLFPKKVRHEETYHHISYAGFWKRFIAYFIDLFILFFFYIVFIFGIYFFLRSRIFFIDRSQSLPVYVSIAINAISFSIGWLYFAIMESSDRQGTIGKNIIGIKVTDIHGQQIGFMKATTRYIAKIISGLTLFLGYIMAGFTPQKQALHDMMAQCLVIDQ